MKATVQESVKIYCKTCEGKGQIYQDRFPDYKRVQVVCPSCDGRGHILMMLVPEEIEV